MNKKREITLIIILAFAIFIIDYSFLDKSLENFLDDKEEINIERIIDGDTIVAEGDRHIRLLGINTPEKGEEYYSEAKEFLSEMVLNKTIILEYGNERKDLYDRTLGYIYADNKNANVKLVREGLANVFIYDMDKHTEELRNAWKECILKNINLCRKSENSCSSCVGVEIENQTVIITNKCNRECNITNWTIKDEGRKKFYFPEFVLKGKVSITCGKQENNNEEFFWNEDYVWTETGDTLFLRDSDGRLVLWKEINR
jgi:endonuclease YncB( thermonuclease family)